MSTGITIRRLADLAKARRLEAQLDEIFFAASSVQIFESEMARERFHYRWLGQFLAYEPDWVYVAGKDLAAAGSGSDDLSRQENVVGYLVAALSDPARDPRFSELGYFQNFSDLTQRFPAQVHINLRADARGQGIGARLLETAVADLAQAGVAGVHVVTGRGMRNVGFYLRNGFAQLGEAEWRSGHVVFLGRALGSKVKAG